MDFSIALSSRFPMGGIKQQFPVVVPKAGQVVAKSLVAEREQTGLEDKKLALLRAFDFNSVRAGYWKA